MTTMVSQYSTNPTDDSILNQIATHLERLSREQQAALVVAALYEGYEPCSVAFDYSCCPSRQFEECVALLQRLSLAGKLALVRAISEHLAVVELTGQKTHEMSLQAVSANQ
jgi:hypothetical protein